MWSGSCDPAGTGYATKGGLRDRAEGRRLQLMDGFVRTVADAFAGLLAGIAGAVAGAVSGVVSTLTSVIPGGMLPVIVIALIVLGLVVILRQ